MAETSEVAAESVGATDTLAAVTDNNAASGILLALGAAVSANPVCGFPALDHQILTRMGFYGLDDFLEHFKRWSKIEVACAVGERIIYCTITAENLKLSRGNHNLILMDKPKMNVRDKNIVSIMTSCDSLVMGKLRKCNPPRLKGQVERAKLVDGPGEGAKPFQPHAMSALKESGDAEGRRAIVLQCLVKEGYTPAEPSPADLTDANVVKLPFAELGLMTLEEKDAFLLLYGYWLGDGSYSAYSKQITFGPVKEKDWNYLDNLFDILKRVLPKRVIEEGRRVTKNQYSISDSEEPAGVAVNQRPDTYKNKYGNYSGKKPRVYKITNAAWNRIFTEEYAIKYAITSPDARPHVRKYLDSVVQAHATKCTAAALASNKNHDDSGPSIIMPVSEPNVKSAKWLLPWVLRLLDMRQTRLILTGLHFADGDQSKKDQGDWRMTGGRIFTSSPRFRDEIVHLMIHAGYTSLFQIMKPKGTENHVSSANNGGSGNLAICRHDGYSVTYCTNASTQFRTADNFRDFNQQGLLWNVMVPTAEHLIFARRVLEHEDGVVTVASRPIVVGDASCSLKATSEVEAAASLVMLNVA